MGVKHACFIRPCWVNHYMHIHIGIVFFLHHVNELITSLWVNTSFLSSIGFFRVPFCIGLPYCSVVSRVAEWKMENFIQK